MVLDRNVNEKCVYSVCVSVGMADVRLSDVEVDPAAMVLAGEVYSG